MSDALQQLSGVSIHATCGHAVRLLSLHSISIHTSQAHSQHQQAPAAGGQRWWPRCRVYDLVFTSAVKATVHGLLSIALHMHSAGLLGQRRLFTVTDFSGNLAVFIPGKSGMKNSANPGRPGNGSPGMETLNMIVRWDCRPNPILKL